MRVVQWAMLANEATFQGSIVLLTGGIVSTIGGNMHNYQFWLGIGVYAIIFSIIIFMLEYPRSKKKKGNTLTRRHQELFTYAMNRMTILHNYTTRAVIYIVLTVPSILSTPALLSSSLIWIGAASYFLASYNGEYWSPVLSATTHNKHTTLTNSPPARPPPRPPTISQSRSYTTRSWPDPIILITNMFIRHMQFFFKLKSEVIICFFFYFYFDVEYFFFLKFLLCSFLLRIQLSWSIFLPIFLCT